MRNLGQVGHERVKTQFLFVHLKSLLQHDFSTHHCMDISPLLQSPLFSSCYTLSVLPLLLLADHLSPLSLNFHSTAGQKLVGRNMNFGDKGKHKILTLMDRL